MSASIDARKLILSKLEELTPVFQKREPELDQLNSFPYKNIEDLKEIGYTTLTLPKEFGGEGMTLTDFLLFQEQIAKGCGSTALSIGWHMGTILEFAEHHHWNIDLIPLLTEAFLELKNKDKRERCKREKKKKRQRIIKGKKARTKKSGHMKGINEVK